MPVWREKARAEPSEVIAARSKRRNTHLKAAAAGSKQPPGHVAEIQKPKQRPRSSIAVKEAAKSFPQGVGSSPLDRNSSNNRYHRGFAQ